jgi:tetratricopeptide (TPR) repeat protein
MAAALTTPFFDRARRGGGPRGLKKSGVPDTIEDRKGLEVNFDITAMLRGWEYDPTSVSARFIKGRDGKKKIQLRLDLGLFQMEIDGRPDGTKPRGYGSLLDYYHSLENTSPQAGKALKLDAEACSELQQESMQYYYRYLSLYALQDFEGVIRDTEHNLGIIELVTRHGEDEDVKWQFLQFYPYVRMMNARAKAEQATKTRKHEDAIAALQKALDDIQAFWREYGENEPGGTPEIDLLNDLLGQVRKRKPQSPADRIQEQLDHAIAVENYEKAAALRDRLAELSRKQADRGGGRTGQKPGT